MDYKAGTIFGRWELQDCQKKSGRYLCKCTCGTEKLVKCSDLTAGKSKSCGCARTSKYGKIRYGQNGCTLITVPNSRNKWGFMSFARFKLENKLGRKLEKSEIAVRVGADVMCVQRLARKTVSCKFCKRQFFSERNVISVTSSKFCEICNSHKVAMEFSLEELCNIKKLRNSGLTLPAIAHIYNCSKSRIHGVLPKFDKFYKINYYKELMNAYTN